MEFSIGAMKAEAMRKAFDIDIEKGRTGVYEDNAKNRRLNRVGQSYGHKKEEEQKTVKTSKKTEQEQKTSAATMESAAQGASDEALKRASQDPKAPADVKAAAKKELENRGGGEKKEEKKTPYQKKSETKSGEEIFNSFDEKKQKELLKIFKDETAQSGYEGDEAVEVISEYLEGGDFTEAEDIAQNYGISLKEANNLVSHLLKLEIDRIKGQSGDAKKKGGNSASKELTDILDPLDDWDNDDWNDADKNAELFSKIRSVVKKYDMSEDEFRAIAKKYPGLDLVYTDYAPHEKVVPIAKEKIRTELKKFDKFTDDDWNDPSKQDAITDKLTFYIRHYNITEDEWKDIVKPYADGLSGLPYSDFK